MINYPDGTILVQKVVSSDFVDQALVPADIGAASEADLQTVSGNTNNNTNEISTLSGSVDQNTSDISTLSGHVDTVSGNLSTEIDNDIQVAIAENLVQALFTTGTDLNTTQSELPLQGTADEDPGSLFTINSSNVTCSKQGLYRVTWLVEGQRGSGSVDRKNLRSWVVLNGTYQTKSAAGGYIRDRTNNNVSVGTTLLVRTSEVNQTIGIRTRQQGTQGSSSFTVASGHLLIEYLGT